MSVTSELAENMDRHGLCDDCNIRKLPVAGRALALKAVCIMGQEGSDIAAANQLKDKFALGDLEAHSVLACLLKCPVDIEEQQ